MSELKNKGNDDQQKLKHHKLAGVVKGVHCKLRRKYKQLHDCDRVWHEHCEDHSLLQQYADAMHHLATEIWTKHPETRIDWCRKMCREYFLEGGLRKVLDKDKRRMLFAQKQQESSSEQSSRLRSRQRQRSKSEERRKCKTPVGCQGGIPDFVVLSASANQIQPYPKDINFDMEYQCPRCDENGMLLPSDTGNNRGASSPAQLEEACNADDTDASPACYEISVSSTFNSAPQGCSVQSGSGSDTLANSDSELIFGLPEGLAPSQPDICQSAAKTMFNVISLPFEGKMRLLDVGSCYNPFHDFDEFYAIGIDLVPATESVYKCDFLYLEVMEPLQLAPDSFGAFLHSLKSPIESLPAETFHIVVFSLLLEYFPSTYQRWICCQKAYQLLAINGILLIITPDSKHQNHNASQMKSWKTAIESIGFIRWRYIKLEHLHCMVFRKVVRQSVPSLIGEIGPDMLYIPQDFSDNNEEMENVFLFDSAANGQEDEMSLKNNFEELPIIA